MLYFHCFSYQLKVSHPTTRSIYRQYLVHFDHHMFRAVSEIFENKHDGWIIAFGKFACTGWRQIKFLSSKERIKREFYNLISNKSYAS